MTQENVPTHRITYQAFDDPSELEMHGMSLAMAEILEQEDSLWLVKVREFMREKNKLAFKRKQQARMRTGRRRK